MSLLAQDDEDGLNSKSVTIANQRRVQSNLDNLSMLQKLFPGVEAALLIPDEEPKPTNFDEVRDKIGYPEQAQLERATGTVIARVLIDEKGAYLKHRIINPVHPALDMAVEEHIQELTFKPATLLGKSIKYWVNVSFEFVSEKEQPSKVNIPENAKE